MDNKCNNLCQGTSRIFKLLMTQNSWKILVTKSNYAAMQYYILLKVTQNRQNPRPGETYPYIQSVCLSLVQIREANLKNNLKGWEIELYIYRCYRSKKAFVRQIMKKIEDLKIQSVYFLLVDIRCSVQNSSNGLSFPKKWMFLKQKNGWN